nr:RNA-binding protein 34 [Tanacetum cinerariifolium]
MMIYLRNMAGFKMDYCKGMSYDDIRLIFEKYFNSNVAFLEKTKQHMEEEDSKALKKASESQVEKAAKKQNLDEEVPVVDDVYTEATPLVRKVPVVDYEIYLENNKPYYKIMRADGSHQLFLSFLSLLRNFDREDLEVLWQLVKEIFTSSKPKNFSDDFLLTTLIYMFEKPNVQAQVGENHIHVDRACPPRKQFKGENAPLYESKKSVFIDNLPFDVKLFSSFNNLKDCIEAIRVVRDPSTSMGKGIAYVLFMTRVPWSNERPLENKELNTIIGAWFTLWRD